MTRFARGTLLAVVGMREVLLCRSCDGEIVTSVLYRAQLVPDDYTSRFAGGDDRETPSPRPSVRPRRHPSGASLPRTSATGAQRALRSVGQTETSAQAGPLDNPTVRKATEAFLHQTSDEMDHLCLVLLGMELGASTRLSSLDEDTSDAIGAWVDSKFGTATPARREFATKTIIALVDHWWGEKWLSTDIAAALR